MSVPTTRTLNLDTLHLAVGNHSTPDDGLCLLEAAAYIAGEPHTSHPSCVSKVLAAFGQELNDVLPDDKRQQLKPLIPAMPGTAGDGLDGQRGYLALDWLIRTYTPAWLDLAGLVAEAAELRSLRRIADPLTARSAGPAVRHGAEKARAAWDATRDAAWTAAMDAAWEAAMDATVDATRAAARDAAWDATWDATWAVARDAARDAAWTAAWTAAQTAARVAARAAAEDAAWDAAEDAAWDAAEDAAWDAAQAALASTVALLQDSAIELFKTMINPA